VLRVTSSAVLRLPLFILNLVPVSNFAADHAGIVFVVLGILLVYVAILVLLWRFLSFPAARLVAVETVVVSIFLLTKEP
jgi:hypothetical protein